MPFQPGNQEAKRGEKAKRFRQQLIAALEDVPEGDVSNLRKVADKLVVAAISGDVQAIKEIADRADGKVPQGIGGSDELGPVQLERIERAIIDPPNRDSESLPPAA